ncbi:MMPL family transporter [Nocardia carnea]|uniref:MMPL family transporter n=1 Tax=Nocardia carnea TaxID=37328 RepID=UPI0024589592|nr:MMPL family transporter [Nocardia carnea]
MAIFLSRVGRAGARHPARAVLAWVVLLFLALGGAAAGMSSAPPPADGDTSAFHIPGAESTEAMGVLDTKFPAPQSPEDAGTLGLVIRSTGPGGVTEGPGRTTVDNARTQLGELPHVAAVSDPFDPTARYLSDDGTTAVVNAEFTELSDSNRSAIDARVMVIADDLRGDGAEVEVSGGLHTESPEIFGPTEIVGAVIAFVVLVMTFGSLVAAGANMLGALIGVAVGILGIFAWTLIEPIGEVTPILAVMLGLAVGIDYCLFILARFRSELMARRSVDEAVARSVGTAGSAVLFAGATVVIALAGLSVVKIGFLTEMGLAGAFAVAIAVAMALTLLPALMKVMGHRALSRRQRAILADQANYAVGGVAADKPTPLDRWAGAVTKRPVRSVLAVVIGLLVMAAPALGLKSAVAVPGGDDPQSTQRAAYAMIEDEFGGTQSPLVVLVEGQIGPAELNAVAAQIEPLDEVRTVIPGAVSADGSAGIVQVIPAHGPIDDSTRDLVREIRTTVDPGAGHTLAVTGETAVSIDTAGTLQQALVTYVGLIVVLSFLLLVLLFRSLLVPLIAALGYLLSFVAALGATVAVFQWGWLDTLLPAPQGDPLLSYLPIILAGILFGLAMDYQVFLVSRMHEAHERGLSPREAILEGFGRSAPVVVAAAAIMTAVFAGFGFSSFTTVASIAFGLTVGVVVDAFLVRMILVPATLALLGKSAWWLPAWLDRVLPSIDAEGHALDEPPAAAERKHAHTR